MRLHVHGAAGTGKTTYALEQWPDALFLAYTGKAALRLREAGAVDAGTIHSVLYRPVRGSTPVRFHLSPDSRLTGARTVVVDECSMCPVQVATHLIEAMSPSATLVVLGDPCQLPPPDNRRTQSPFISKSPDILLEKVHRQAAGSPILEYATRIREARSVDVPVPPGIPQVHRPAATPLYQGHDVLLCGTNKRRSQWNEYLCSRLHPEHPRARPLVVLRNYREANLFNGSLLSTGELCAMGLDPLFPPPAGTPERPGARTAGVLVDLAYMLTDHKALGREWDRVALFAEDAHCFREHAWRWLYTGVTRAREQLTLVKTRQ